MIENEQRRSTNSLSVFRDFTVVFSDCIFVLFFNLSLHGNKAPEVVEKPGDNSLSKLKNLYAHAKELSENEVTYVCSYLSFS